MNEPRKVLSAPIERVTVLEDRALVERRVSLAASTGRTQLRISNLAAILSDKTLAVRATGAGVRLDDLRVRRERIASLGGTNRELAEMRLEVAQSKQVQAEISQQIEVQKKRVTSLLGLRQSTYAEISEDVSWNRVDKEAWSSSLDRLSAAIGDAEMQIAKLQDELSSKSDETGRKALRLSYAEQPSSKVDAWLEIDLTGDGSAAGDWELVISYVVPGACWRPQHAARLIADSVHFECDAVVWQNTGEDWKDTTLTFSTERASLGTSAPLLHSDVLMVTRKRDTFQVEARDQRIEEASAERAGPPGDAPLPGIDDGGQAQHLRAPGKHTVVSDGRPHRFSVFSFDSVAKRALVCMPEISLNVFDRVEFTNTGEHPVLAGPVDLEKSGGACGRTRVLFVAPGESFKLAFGTDSNLRVDRSVRTLPDQATMLSGTVTKTHDVLIKLSNLGGESRAVSVRERVPVSEIEKVSVNVVDKDTTGGKRPDENGFVDWDLTLPGNGQTKIQLRVSIKRSSDVLGM